MRLLRETGATTALVDIGGDRGLPAVAAVVALLQGVGVPRILVKCQAMLESALAHMQRVSPAHATAQPDPPGDPEGNATAPADSVYTAAKRDACCAALASDCTQARIAEAGANTQHCASTSTTHSIAARKRHPDATARGSEAQERKRQRKLAKQALPPKHVLWRWRNRAMPRAWDLEAHSTVEAEGLVREGLAVVLDAADWWQQQVRVAVHDYL